MLRDFEGEDKSGGVGSFGEGRALAKDRIVKAKKAADEGIQICVEQIEELKEIKGVRGIHLMAIEWEHKVPEIAEQAGLLPRPVM